MQVFMSLFVFSFLGDLAPHAPMKSLISLTPICSLLLQLAVIISFQVTAFLYVQEQPWFIPFNASNPNYTGTEWEEYYATSTITDSEVRT